MNFKNFTKSMAIASVLILSFQGLNAQMKIATNGKVGFKTSVPEWGTIEINKDGKHDGVCIYEPAKKGSTYRMFRDNDYGYLTRGGDFDRGIRISNLGTVDVFTKTDAIRGDMFNVTVNKSTQYGFNVKHGYMRVFAVKGTGEVWGKAFNLTSDANLKENIHGLDNSLSQLMKLNGVSYNFKKTNIEPSEETVTDDTEKNEPEYGIAEEVDAKLQKQLVEDAKKRQLGLLAQEVEMVYPELVSTDPNGNLAVNYIGLIPVLIEALKEQQQQILKQEENISELKSLILVKSTTDITSVETSGALLKQNRPNPFNEQTTIEFYLPETVSKAMLNIFDLTGKQVKSFDIVQRFEGEVKVFANELQPGMYKYALIADGSIVDTHSMIITN